MAIRLTAAILAAAMVLAGCASTPIAIEAFSIEGLRKIEYRQLCGDYHLWGQQGRLTAKSRDQLEAVLLEKGMPPKDLKSAREGSISIGMTQDGMYAAWGRTSKENETVTPYGTNIQHVYENDNTFPYVYYVYTQNGIVTSWQKQKMSF